MDKPAWSYLGLVVAMSFSACDAHAAPQQVGPCDGAYASASGLTDYRFDGFSESDRHPTWQVTGYCYWRNGIFIGSTLTGVDFQDTPRTNLEVDWYAGRQLQWRGTKVTLQLLYASFPDKRAPGPSYDIVEPQVEVSHTLGKATLDATGGWETDASGRGQEWRLRAGASFALTSWLALGSHLGDFLGATGADHDHYFYDVGAKATWRRLSVDLGYGGTSLPMSECYYTHWCEPGVYATLSWRAFP